MRDEAPVIVALGASTPIGRDAWSSAAAVRAGIGGFTEHPYLIDTVGAPMRAAIAPWLDIDLTGAERFKALLFPAIDQTLARVEAAPGPKPRIALSLGLPEPRPGLPADLQPALQGFVQERYAERFCAYAALPRGHAAGLIALQAAAQKLAQGAFDACVVAGVDSYLEAETMQWLERCDQLHGAGALNNAWGLIPGEAAGALLLARPDWAERLRLAPLARLLSVGAAVEDKRIKTETVCIGAGLTQALRVALEALPEASKVGDIYCDLNGELYRADEYGFALVRVRGFVESGASAIAAAECWGDVCAAGGPLHIGLAAIAGRKGYAGGERALIWASSEGGARAACVVQPVKVD